MWLDRCVMCGTERAGLAYRAGGLCKRCHRMAERAGVLEFWRIESILRRDPAVDDVAIILQQIARVIGVAEAARRLDLGASAFRAYAIGGREIPDQVRAQAILMWVGSQNAG